MPAAVVVVDPIDTITDNVIKWLFTGFPKKFVKPLVNRLLTIVCDNLTDVTEIQRDLATQALLNGTVANLTQIQQDLANATVILGSDYQTKIGIFMDKIFQPFLIDLPDIAATNFTDVKTCKSNVTDEINFSLTKASSADAIKKGLINLKPPKTCVDLFPFLENYFPFEIHNITEGDCGVTAP
uniref:Uncharacterized protein n=1 Tax=Panagrolaimus sp. ES5 TaxID=591445 RepID=A0AC34FGS8_9BILA